MSKKEEKILNATIKLFIREGIKRITMDDIAAHANISKVTIYKYFADKDTLFLAVGKQIFSQHTDVLRNIVASEDTLVKKFYRYIDAVSEFTNRGELGLCAELAKYSIDIEGEYEKFLQAYKRLTLALIDEGIAHGLIKSGLDRETVFYYIDMGVVYYQQKPEYRGKMLSDSAFRQRYIQFYISHIFDDEAQI
jgi:AcrR family transcriptional regulator